MDLSIAYDCFPHDLLIAKLDAYGLYKPSINLVNDLNSLITNPEKFQFMILQKFLRSKYCLTIGPINVKKLDHLELWRTTIDKYLDTKKDIDNLCWNVNYKVHAARLMRKKLTVEKAKLLSNAFFNSQFNSASLILMFYQKTLYFKIEKIHHKTLRIIQQSNGTYRDLLECNGSTSFYQRHLQFLLMKIYKSTVTTNPKIM